MAEYHEIALPVLVEAVGMDSNNRIPSTLATYLGELRLLADGRVQTMDDLVLKDEEEEEDGEITVIKKSSIVTPEKEIEEKDYLSAPPEVDTQGLDYEIVGHSEKKEYVYNEDVDHPILSLIEPTLETAVSNLAYSVYQDLATGFSKNTSTSSLPKSSLASLVIASNNAYVPKKVNDMIKATLLETYAIAKVLSEDKSLFTSSIAESDISRLVGNIRWVTNKLALVKDYNLDVIAYFRWLERAFKYIEKSETLYSAAVTKVLSNFNQAKGED